MQAGFHSPALLSAADRTLQAFNFFNQSVNVKRHMRGYSPFASERVKGKTAIPKESVYFRDSMRSEIRDRHSIELCRSVEGLHEVSIGFLLLPF